jgi:hypothetical protein
MWASGRKLRTSTTLIDAHIDHLEQRSFKVETLCFQRCIGLVKNRDISRRRNDDRERRSMRVVSCVWLRGEHYRSAQAWVTTRRHHFAPADIGQRDVALRYSRFRATRVGLSGELGACATSRLLRAPPRQADGRPRSAELASRSSFRAFEAAPKSRAQATEIPIDASAPASFTTLW